MKQQPFSWSLSRDNTMSMCEKKYGYHYYVSQNGWSFKASPDAQQAFKLKKLATPEMLIGKIIHDLIEEVFNSLVGYQAVMNEQQMFERFVKDLKKEFLDPKTSLFHLHYNERGSRTFNELTESYKHVFTNFFNSETWKMVTEDPSSYEIISFEQFETFELNGITVYAVMDLVIHDIGNDIYYIIDWKTGKQNPNDTTQLMFYKIHFLMKHEVESDRVFCVNEYLNSGQNTRFNPDEETLNQVINEMFVPSVERMQKLLTSEVSNTPLPIEMFKGCNNAKVCSLCNFKELCKPKVLEEDKYDKFF